MLLMVDRNANRMILLHQLMKREKFSNSNHNAKSENKNKKNERHIYLARDNPQS